MSCAGYARHDAWHTWQGIRATQGRDTHCPLPPHTGVLTRRDPKAVHHRLHQPQHVEGTATDVGQEKHDPDAAPKLRAQGTADHILLESREDASSPKHHWVPSPLPSRPGTQSHPQYGTPRPLGGHPILAHVPCPGSTHSKGYSRLLRHPVPRWWRWHTQTAPSCR